MAQGPQRAEDLAPGPVGGHGVPGAVEGGTIVYTCNIPMKNIPMERMFRSHLDLPVHLGNDADCAALGEYHCGAGKGCRSLVAITLGTGIGGGMVFDGKIYEGLGMAGEVGHMVVEPGGVPCPCGRRGCWEQYASASGLRRMTWEAMEAHRRASSGRSPAGSGSGSMAARRLKRPDGAMRPPGPCAGRISATLPRGSPIWSICSTPRFWPLAAASATSGRSPCSGRCGRLWTGSAMPAHGGRKTRVVKALLGNDAGVIGAAFLGRSR